MSSTTNIRIGKGEAMLNIQVPLERSALRRGIALAQLALCLFIEVANLATLDRRICRSAMVPFVESQ
jgi:hypothetical protein